MVVSIRLSRTGRKRINTFRVVVIHSKFKRDSKRVICDLGYYLPQRQEYLKMNIENYNKWIAKGAQPTKRVVKLYKIAYSNQQYVYDK